MQCKIYIFVLIIEYNNVVQYYIILSLITLDQSLASIVIMFQYHYLEPDDWVKCSMQINQISR